MRSGPLEQYYNRLGVFKQHGIDVKKSRRFVLKTSGIKKGDSVLEIGTGKGHTAIGLARKKVRFTTIDIDKEALRISRGNLKAFGLLRYARIRRMDAEHLRYGNDSFDYVVSVNFIHHAKHPRRCIKEMARVTKRFLVIADLNKQGEKVMDRVLSLDGRKHNKSRISLNGIKQLLKKIGLDVTVYHDRYQTVFVAKKG